MATPPVNSIPICPSDPIPFVSRTALAQTDKSGLTAGNIVTAVTAARPGLVQDLVVALPGAASAAACVVIFHNKGGVRNMIAEVAFAIGSGSNTAACLKQPVVINRWLGAGDKLEWLTTIAQETQVSGNYGEG